MNSTDVVVECTWSVENISDVATKILWKDELCELTEETDIDNCFAMNQPNLPGDNIPCTLKLSLKNNKKFSALQILSGASVLEIYGNHEEYILTSKGDLLDDIDGTLLFENRIQLTKLQPEVLLKFHRKNNISTIWVYGISAVTKIITEKPKIGLPESLCSSLAMLSVGLNKGKPNDNIHLIIDMKFKEMEQHLTKVIDERFHQLEEKLEQGNMQLMNMLSQLIKEK